MSKHAQAAQRLTYCINLQCLLSVFAGEGFEASHLPIHWLRNAPGAPRVARVLVGGSAATVVVYPFADLLLSLLQGLGCHVELVTWTLPKHAAMSVLAAVGWDTFDVLCCTGQLVPPAVAPLNLASLHKPLSALASTVVIETATDASADRWSVAMSPYLIIAKHLRCDTNHLYGSGGQSRANRYRNSSSGPSSASLLAASYAYRHVPQFSTLADVRRQLRCSMESLGLLPVLQKSLRLAEFYLSGAGALRSFDVRSCAIVAEGNLFRGMWFDVVDSSGSSAAATSISSSVVCSSTTSTSVRAMELALLIQRFGGDLVSNAHIAATTTMGGGEQIIRVLTASLGEVPDDDPTTQQQNNNADTININTAAIIASDEDHNTSTLQQATTRRLVVNHDWVHACISTWSVVPFDATTVTLENNLDAWEPNSSSDDDDDVHGGDIAVIDVDEEGAGARAMDVVLATQRRREVHRYVAAHLLLLLAPPCGAPCMDVGTLRDIFLQCHVSWRVLEDGSFIRAMEQEVEFVYSNAASTATQVAEPSLASEEVVVVDDDERPDEVDRDDDTNLQPHEDGELPPPPARSSSVSPGGTTTTTSSGAFVKTITGFRSKRRRIAIPSDTFHAHQQQQHLQTLRSMLHGELHELLKKPVMSDAATQTWLAYRASTATMTEAPAASPTTATTSAAKAAPGGSSVATKSASTAPLSSTTPTPAAAAGAEKIFDNIAPTSSSGALASAAPVPAGTTPASVGRKSSGGPPPSYASGTASSPPTGAKAPNTAPGGSSTAPTTTAANNRAYTAPSSAQEAAAPDARFKGMRVGYNYRVFGRPLSDVMFYEFPLYAYGVQLEKNASAKAIKALFKKEEPRAFEGVSFEMIPAPEAFTKHEAATSSAVAAGWISLRANFRTNGDALRFLKGRTHVTLATKDATQVLCLSEGERLECTRQQVASSTSPQSNPTAIPTSTLPVESPLQTGAGGVNKRLRSQSPEVQSRRGTARTTAAAVDSRPAQRRRTPSPPKLQATLVRPTSVAAVPLPSRAYHDPIVPLAQQTKQAQPSWPMQHIQVPPPLPPSDNILQLSPEELQTLNGIGSSVGQLLANPDNIEAFAFEHLHGFAREQRFMVCAVQKARRYLQAHLR